MSIELDRLFEAALPLHNLTRTDLSPSFILADGFLDESSLSLSEGFPPKFDTVSYNIMYRPPTDSRSNASSSSQPSDAKYYNFPLEEFDDDIRESVLQQKQSRLLSRIVGRFLMEHLTFYLVDHMLKRPFYCIVCHRTYCDSVRGGGHRHGLCLLCSSQQTFRR